MSTITKSGVVIKDYNEFVCINLDAKSVIFYKGKFICKNKRLHNKVFTQIVTLPKLGFHRYGEPKHEFYLNTKNAPIFSDIEDLITYYNDPESFPARIRSRKLIAFTKNDVELNVNKMTILSKIKARVLNLVNKVKSYFKTATVKGVAIDVCKAIWRFFHWHFASIVLGAFASWIVAEESYPFLGWILLVAFMIMLILNLNSKKTEVTQ